VRRLLQLIAQDGTFFFLRLPPHEPRPGLEQRLVHDLHTVVRRLARVPFDLVGGEQPRVDQRAQDVPGGGAIREGRQQLLTVHDRARALRRDQVAEQLAHDVLLHRADAVQRGFGVLRQRPGHAATRLVGLAREQLARPVALLPEACDRKGEQRQRPARALDALHHLVDERLVFEPVAARTCRLDDGAAQGVAGERAERRERVEDQRERLVLVAAHQEVVAQREDDVEIGVVCEPPEESRDARLGLRRV